MGKHFIQMLSGDTPPQPAIEVARVLEVSALGDGTPVWFGSTKRRAWASDGSPSWCVVFYRQGGGRVGGFAAQVVGHQEAMPDVDWLRELYAGTSLYRAWWRLEGIVALPTGGLLKAIPGYSPSGLLAEATFRGRNPFAFWNFDEDPRPVLLSHLPALPPPTAAAGPAPKRCAPPAATPGALGFGPLMAPSGPALHGVDFSGGQETEAGNPKIWVASWVPTRADNRVQLECGTDTGLKRRDLPELVRTRGGVWVMDFPFGVALDTARALGLPDNDWSAWLQWASAGQADAYEPTERRDLARALAASAGVPWSARRQVDEAHKTTWFPLFEQLYRQTLFGAREVLAPLAEDPSVAVVPFDTPRPNTPLISEGFPGWTLRRRFGHEGMGYKGDTARHRQERDFILRALVAAGLPVGDAELARAVEDSEGDAVDALVLLLAAWETRQQAEAAGLLAEGWFFA